MLPDIGINTTLVGNTIGVSTHNVGQLCTSDKINYWSKCKPLHIPNASSVNRVSDWWKGQNGLCGFIPKRLETYKLVVDNMDGGLNGWQYDKPRGTSFSPFRIGDFGKYDHNALPFVANLLAPLKVVIKDSGNFGISAAVNLGGGSSLSLSDLDFLKDYHFGVYLKEKNGLQSRAVTATSTIGTGYAEVTLPNRTLTIGDWNVYPILAEKVIELDSPETANVFYTVPNLNMITIEGVGSMSKVLLDASLNGFMADWSVKIINNSNATLTYKNCHLTFRKSRNDFHDPLEYGEFSLNLGNITVNPNTTYTKTGSDNIRTIIEGISGSEQNMAKIWLSLNSGGELYQTELEMDPSVPGPR